MHLPFVHHNTIGRGGRTVVDGPLVKWVDGDKMNVYVYNRQDDGTPPLKPDEVPQPQGPFRLAFHFPNVWENHRRETGSGRLAHRSLPQAATRAIGRGS